MLQYSYNIIIIIVTNVIILEFLFAESGAPQPTIFNKS